MQKTIYLIRHGETMANRAWIHQFPVTPLSDLGEKQAARVAERMSHLHIDALVSSDIHRAAQTAEAISTATGVSIVFNPLFQEIIRPSQVMGKGFIDPRSLFVFGQLYIHATNLKWHYSDEENFAEFRDRAHKAIELLESYDAHTMAVVSHRIFIGGILAELECRFACSMEKFIRRSAQLGRLANTSVTTLTYDPNRAEPWRVEGMNDTSHL